MVQIGNVTGDTLELPVCFSKRLVNTDQHNHPRRLSRDEYGSHISPHLFHEKGEQHIEFWERRYVDVDFVGIGNELSWEY